MSGLGSGLHLGGKCSISLQLSNILEKLPPYMQLFSSSCGELQPSAANSRALRAHFFKRCFWNISGTFLWKFVFRGKFFWEFFFTGNFVWHFFMGNFFRGNFVGKVFFRKSFFRNFFDGNIFFVKFFWKFFFRGMFFSDYWWSNQSNPWSNQSNPWSN